MNRVFLGGTCNNSKWRSLVKKALEIGYFDPVVEDWTEECKEEELKQREECDYCLYVITPRMKGVYSIAEAVDDSNKRPEKTLFCILRFDEEFCFDKQEYNSLKEVRNLVERNGAKVFKNLSEVVTFLNTKSDIGGK